MSKIYYQKEYCKIISRAHSRLNNFPIKRNGFSKCFEFYSRLILYFPGEKYLPETFLPLLCKSPYLAFKFMENNLLSWDYKNKHKKVLETTIALCAYNSYYYASKILKNRFPAGEKSILINKGIIRDCYFDFLKSLNV